MTQWLFFLILSLLTIYGLSCILPKPEHAGLLMWKEKMKSVGLEKAKVFYFSIFIIVVLIAPFLEETLFRWLLQGQLIKFLHYPILNPVIICLVAALFGLAHEGKYMFSYSFILGLILGIFYYVTNNFWGVVALHSAINIHGMAGFYILLRREKLLN